LLHLLLTRKSTKNAFCLRLQGLREVLSQMSYSIVLFQFIVQCLVRCIISVHAWLVKCSVLAHPYVPSCWLNLKPGSQKMLIQTLISSLWILHYYYGFTNTMVWNPITVLLNI